MVEINYKDISKALKLPEERVKESLDKMAKEGLISKNGEMYCLTMEGINFMDLIKMK